MNTLRSEYDTIITSTQYGYYSVASLKSYPVEKKEATTFIREYFLQGGKRGALDNVVGVREDEIYRAEHMVSAFFLGILLYHKIRKIQDSINRKINELQIPTNQCSNEYKEESPEKLFLYIWFLTCLYHDIGYDAENRHDDSSIEIDHVLSELQISKKAIPDELSDNCKLYYALRKSGKIKPPESVIDHGIIGGCMLYHHLERLHTETEIVERNGLYWGKSILKHYIAPAACAIIAHNMWMQEAGTEDADRYKDLLLDGLIYSPGNRIIQLKDHPLLFLLCLVDTIEPLKRGKKLDEVWVEIDDNCIVVKNATFSSSDLNFLAETEKIADGMISIKL